MDAIDNMVNRFLSWELPRDFAPDCGISFKPDYNQHTPWPARHKPVGTNLFTAEQAKAMILYLLGEAHDEARPAPDQLSYAWKSGYAQAKEEDQMARDFCPHCNPCLHDGGEKCRDAASKDNNGRVVATQGSHEPETRTLRSAHPPSANVAGLCDRLRKPLNGHVLGEATWLTTNRADEICLERRAAADALTRLSQEARDAARYRWLRANRGGSRDRPWAMIFDNDLEQFIDAAMAANKE